MVIEAAKVIVRLQSNGGVGGGVQMEIKLKSLKQTTFERELLGIKTHPLLDGHIRIYRWHALGFIALAACLIDPPGL